jgi:hypothetical protein
MFLLFDEAIARAISLELRYIFKLFYYFMVALMLERCLHYMADNISVRIYLSLGNQWFVITPAEYLHIQLLQDFILMFGKMSLLSSFNFPRAYTNGRLIGNWLIF